MIAMRLLRRAALAIVCAVGNPGFGQSVESQLPAAARPFVPCGATSLAIAAKIVGRPIPNESLASAVREDGSSTFADLRRVALEHGLYAVSVMLNPEQLSNLRHVAILQLVMRPRLDRPWQEHFTVYAGPSSKRGVIHVLDPIAELGRGEVLLRHVAEKWTGAALLVADRPIDLGALRLKPASPWPTRVASALIGAVVCWLVMGVLWIRKQHRRTRSAVSEA
ncbi:MAG: hypothetical protein KF678_03640 [Phycisphaeraceae bacterium]|nr:hypothetical protein [Phycisphaeraceae bacterium]